VEVFETKRGGDVTFHGPGQLVGYPICDLRGFSPRIGAVEFVRRIEEVLIRACGDHGIPTKRICGLTGVWTGEATPTECDAAVRAAQPSSAVQEKKIAAIGVHISRGITSHGFALNVTTDLEQFKLIVPCGISDKPVASMELELGDKTPPMEAVCNAVTRHFGNLFGVQVLWLESLESLLKHSANTEHSRPGPPNQDTPLREPDDLKRMREELERTPNDDIHWA
jgi:lipoyl(octanoyl) transferase